MIASVYRLNRSDLNAMSVKDMLGLYRAVHRLFPDVDSEEGRGFLFADRGEAGGGHEVVILSRRAPLEPRHGSIQSQTLPASFLEHRLYRFEVVLNPTKRHSVSGKLVAVRGRAALKKWFVAKAPKHGFEVEPRSLLVTATGVTTYQRGRVNYFYNTATFRGRLRVTDQAAFVKAFEQGIGREKGLGFGLLQIVPVVK